MSAGRSVLLVFCVALLVSAGIPAAAAGGNVISFAAPVTVTDPCTGEVGTGTLDVLIVVDEVATSTDRVHVNVHARVHGELVGDRGSVYHVSAEGTAELSSLADLYDVPFHGNAVGAGPAPNVFVDGVAGVGVGPGGNPIGVGLISLSASCGL